MSRYIDADKLIENCEFFETEMEVKNAPTEDVAPIVRCKYCKHCGYTSNGYDRQYIMCCNKLNLDTEIYGDFYCGYAEKMEESGETQ